MASVGGSAAAADAVDDDDGEAAALAAAADDDDEEEDAEVSEEDRDVTAESASAAWMDDACGLARKEEGGKNFRTGVKEYSPSITMPY